MNASNTSTGRVSSAYESLRPRGSIPLRFGAITGRITGGPFHGAEHWAARNDLTIKLAEEIEADCDVSLPIRDFSVPSELAANEAITKVFQSFSEGGNAYAGCMAGQGRTGLFIALLVKVALDFERYQSMVGLDVTPQFPEFNTGDGTSPDPILIVRGLYYRHAVETTGQAAFVRNFDTSYLVSTLARLQPVSSGLGASGRGRGGWLSRVWAALRGFLRG